MIQEALFDIDQVNQMTGLPQATLRNWEKRYGFPKPRRTTGGHRLYEVEEVRKIREVAQLYKSGMKVQDAIGAVLGTSPKPDAETENQTAPFKDALQLILQALYKYDLAVAEDMLSRIGLRLNETELLEMVYPQLLSQVGMDWETQKINVAQEHFCWSYLRGKLLNYLKFIKSNSLKPKVIVATPAGELHEGGALILSAFLVLHGWQVFHLGANLPIQDLKHAIESIHPHVVCLSSVDPVKVSGIWKELNSLPVQVAVGGACVSELKSLHLESENIALMEASMEQAVSQLEMFFHAASQKTA